MKNFGIVLSMIAGLLVGYLVGSGSRNVVMAPPAASTEAVVEPNTMPLPVDAVLNADAAATGSTQQKADQGAVVVASAADRFDPAQRERTMRVLLQSRPSEALPGADAIVASPRMNPDGLVLSPEQMTRLAEMIEDHRDDLLEALVVREILQEDICAAKLERNDVEELPQGTVATARPFGDTLVSGLVCRDGKSLVYTIKRDEYPELDATYEIQRAIEEELDGEVKDFFSTLRAR